MRKKSNKKRTWSYIDVCYVENYWNDILINCWWCITVVLLWIVHWYEMVIFSLIVWIWHLHWFWDMVMTNVMWIKKEYDTKENVPFQGTCHAPRWILWFEECFVCLHFIIKGHVARCNDAWTYMFPMGVELRKSGCLSLGQILHHHTCYCTAYVYHLWTCECLSMELLFDEIYRVCYWYVIVGMLWLSSVI